MQNFVKYKGNPVLGDDQLGTCFDVYVWKDGDKFRMDFSWRREESAAVSFSSDGITWSEPKITLAPNDKSGWEKRINRNCVIKVDGVYKMYYTGQSEAFSYVGLAESKDGIHFKRVQDEPIMIPEFPYEGFSVMNPCVLYEEGKYKMWYSSGETYEPNFICYAESEDGIHFKKHRTNPILMKKWQNWFEKDRLGGCQVIHTEDMGYLMFYIGYEDIDTARICVARSDNGITGWERSELNPIVQPTVGEWDENATYKPSAIWLEETGEWRVYYNGRRKNKEYVGFASINERDLFENEQLRSYVDKFNAFDEESVVQAVPNANAYEYLRQNAPRLSCPDKTIEEVFAFRSWTVRKHIKETDEGVMMTEFLPPVAWAGKHNTINAALFHHLNEYRWFKNADRLISYALFFLKNSDGRAYNYYAPALTAICEFMEVTGNGDFIRENLDLLEKYFIGWEERHLTKSGLYWSEDSHDAMEFSISGTTPDPNGKQLYERWLKTCDSTGNNAKSLKGLRPTLNAYMYGDAMTLSKAFASVGNEQKAEFYKQKAQKIKALMDEKLWDGDFYKAVHAEDIDADLSTPLLTPEMNAKEIIGYIPWAYRMLDGDKSTAFKYLKDEKTFLAPMGFATADRSHERYLYPAPHECLWNGYVWPFATSQTINSVISLLNNYEQDVITNADLYDFIKTYASMHYIEDEKGKHCFIDEKMHPDKPVWVTRKWLKDFGWPEKKGGYERGKDYNHSTFMDLVLRGLIGIDENSETLSVKPKIKGIWKWFKVENLTFRKRNYTIYYDEDGKKFGKGVGVIIERND